LRKLWREGHKGLELPALPARVQSDASMELEELVHRAAVQRTPEPCGSEALRRHAREDCLDSCIEVVLEEPARVEPPLQREDSEAEFVADLVNAAVLIVARDRADNDAVDVDGCERAAKRVELCVLALPRVFLDERSPHRFREERDDVEVRDVVQHRRGVLRHNRDKVRDVPAPLTRDVDRVGRVLPARVERGDPHAP